jgi:hypothetical protein
MRAAAAAARADLMAATTSRAFHIAMPTRDLAPDVARELIPVMIETGQPLPPGLHRLASPTRVQLVVSA